LGCQEENLVFREIIRKDLATIQIMAGWGYFSDLVENVQSEVSQFADEIKSQIDKNVIEEGV
jgi:hypothetical protein